MTKHNHTAGTLALLALLGAAPLAGCRGERSSKPPRQFLPDMDDSPKYKPQTRTEFFLDGRAMREPVLGTVPFGETTNGTKIERARFLREDAVFFTGSTGLAEDKKTPLYVQDIPGSAVDAFMSAGVSDKAGAAVAMLDRGEERFKMICSVCHGFDGKGEGMVGQKWSYKLTDFSFHTDQYQKDGNERKDPTKFKWRDGFVFWTIRNGVPDPGTGQLKMPSYAHALPEKDAWAVVAYLRTLQSAYRGIDAASPDIPEQVRQDLQRTKPPPAPPAPAPTPAPPTAPPPPAPAPAAGQGGAR